METGNIVTISVGTITIVSVLGYLIRFSIDKFFAFKEKNYESQLNIKVKEFETKLSQVLPERIIVIKTIFQHIIEVERQASNFVNQQGDEKMLLESYNNIKKEFYLNEFYFNSSQRTIIKKIINEFFACYADMYTFHQYGDVQYLSQDARKEKFEFSKNARSTLDFEIPKIKEELIQEIQTYYQIT
jgi:hypothetical protein